MAAQSVRSSVARLVVGWTAVLTVILAIGGALPTPRSLAAVTSMTCYTAADGGDRAVTLAVQEDTAATPTHTTGSETVLGAIGVPDVEAVALAPGGSTLYTANGGVFGTINMTGGSFTAIGSGLGTSTDSVTYNGSTGTFTGGQTINFNTYNDIDGLTFDPFTGKLWGIVRVAESSYPPAPADPPAEYDQLVIIDPSTGTFVGQQFRNPGDTSDITDSVPVTPPSGTNDDINIGDIDDLAIDPATGILYGVANAGAVGDQLIKIDKITGRSTIVGSLGITDVEGLGFSNVGGLFGEFFATTGDLSNVASEQNRFWRVNTSNGSVIDEDTGTAGYQALHAFNTTTSGTDYEAMDCLSSTVYERQISGYVYVDVNQDGVYNSADGDTAYQNASVRLYIDDGSGGSVTSNNNKVDDDHDGTHEAGEDRFVDNVVTNSSGFYSFTVSFPTGTTTAPKDFVLEVNTDTLPTGHKLTDGGNEEASFAGDPPNSNDTGQTNGVNNTDGSGNNVNNNFGFASSPVISKTVAENETAVAAGLPSSTLPQAGDIMEYTVTVTNTSTVASPQTYSNVVVTDTTPSGTTDLTCTYTVHDLSASSTSAPVNCGASPTRVPAGGQPQIDLERGDYITMTYRVQVNTPLTITSVENTACRTISGASKECDSTSTAIGASLGDVVFRDSDRDGTQDAGETGLNGVDVTCTGAGSNGTFGDGDDTTRTVTTAKVGGTDGYYDCTRLAAGKYRADVDAADAVALVASAVLTTGNDPTGDITLTAAQDYNDADFGFEAPAASASPSPSPSPSPPAEPQFIDIELTKDASKTYLDVGEEFSYTLRVTNAVPGATSVAMNVRVTDQLPDGVTYVSHTAEKGEYDPETGVWLIGALRKTEVQTLTIFARADEPGQYVNVAYVSEASGNDVDSTPGDPHEFFQDDEDDARIEVGLIDLELTKEVSDGTVAAGQEFAFELTVTNVEVPSSPRTPAGQVSVADTLPEGLRFVRFFSTQGEFDSQSFLWFVGDLDVGQSAELTLVVVADREGSFTNIAQVSSTDGTDVDSTPGNDAPDEDDQDEASVVVTVRGAIGDTVWLDVNGNGVQDPDEVGLPGVLVALAGPFNSRPSSVGTVEAELNLQTDGGGRYLFDELEPGLYIVVCLEDTVPEGLANTNGANWYEVSIGPGANYVDADFGYQPSSQELSVLKTVTPSGRVSMGDEPLYTITVTNTGWRTLEDVVVTDQAPEGTTYRPGTTTLDGAPMPDIGGAGDPLPLHPSNSGLTLGDLEPGDSHTVSFGVTVNFQEPREIPNVAEVASVQTGVVKSNQVVIDPAIPAGSGETLPATGGPVDRLLLLAGALLALGGVSLWSVRGPRPVAPLHRPHPEYRFFTAAGGFQRPPRGHRRKQP